MGIECTQHQKETDAQTCGDCPRLGQRTGRPARKATVKALQSGNTKDDIVIQGHERSEWRTKTHAPQPEAMGALVLIQHDVSAVRTLITEIRL